MLIITGFIWSLIGSRKFLKVDSSFLLFTNHDFSIIRALLACPIHHVYPTSSLRFSELFKLALSCVHFITTDNRLQNLKPSEHDEVKWKTENVEGRERRTKVCVAKAGRENNNNNNEALLFA